METERKKNWESIPIVITFIGFKKRKKKKGKKKLGLPCGESNPGHGGESAGS